MVSLHHQWRSGKRAPWWLRAQDRAPPTGRGERPICSHDELLGRFLRGGVMFQANSPCLDDSIEVRLPIALGPIACRLQRALWSSSSASRVRGFRSPMTGFCAGAHCVPSDNTGCRRLGFESLRTRPSTRLPSGFDPISWSTVSAQVQVIPLAVVHTPLGLRRPEAEGRSPLLDLAPEDTFSCSGYPAKLRSACDAPCVSVKAWVTPPRSDLSLRRRRHPGGAT